MRNTVLAIAATASILAAPSLTPAQAMTAGTAPGVRAAVEQTAGVQDAAYVCRHRSWSSRRLCWWQPTYRGWRWHWRRP